MAVFKINLAIALGLLAAVSGNVVSPHLPCPADNLDCKCYSLFRPSYNATASSDGGPWGKAIKACEDKLQTKVPAPPAPTAGTPPPFRYNLDGMSQEFKNCVSDNFYTSLGVMKNGAIDVAAMQANYRQKINANKKADTTDAQVQKIVDAVPGCITSSGGTTALKSHDFMTCMKAACVTALTP
ncbi:uncharacterized protein [Macrobrachium rosenbergii]|uniref:uncharacterized protein n=1 Tax=Macrobrachium rosenbergii TaxID=79674 RepID=UPI0034D51C6D